MGGGLTGAGIGGGLACAGRGNGLAGAGTGDGLAGAGRGDGLAPQGNCVWGIASGSGGGAMTRLIVVGFAALEVDLARRGDPTGLRMRGGTASATAAAVAVAGGGEASSGAATATLAESRRSPEVKDRETLATAATSAPHDWHAKRPGDSSELHSGQTTVFVAIDHLGWKPDAPRPVPTG